MPLEVAPSDDGSGWSSYVRGHPQATYCHLYEWRLVAERAYRRRCSYLAARRDGRPVGVLPLVWMPGRLAGHRLVSLPYLDRGGPLADDDEAERALEEAARELGRERGAAAVELRGPDPEEADATDTRRFRFVLELPEDRELLWKTVGGKVRNQVRKSRSAELVTERADPAELPRFYEVFSRNMRDLGSPVHGRRFFAELLALLGDRAHLYLTRDGGGAVVAGAVGIVFDDTLTVPWASSSRAARSSCPNHSLYWTILEGAVDDGRRSFDFGRSSVGTGTYRFKKQWGAEPLPLVWRRLQTADGPPAADSLSPQGNPLLVRLWSRLPLAFANLLGPRIRGRLPH